MEDGKAPPAILIKGRYDASNQRIILSDRPPRPSIAKDPAPVILSAPPKVILSEAKDLIRSFGATTHNVPPLRMTFGATTHHGRPSG